MKKPWQTNSGEVLGDKIAIDRSPSPKKEEGDFIPIDRNPSPEKEEKENFTLEEEHQRYKNHDLKSDIKLKRAYFSVTRKITRYWIGFIMIASLLQYCARLFEKGFVSTEFIALITTTTATLVGFWAIVGAYLFPRRGPKI